MPNDQKQYKCRSTPRTKEGNGQLVLADNRRRRRRRRPDHEYTHTYKKIVLIRARFDRSELPGVRKSVQVSSRKENEKKVITMMRCSRCWHWTDLLIFIIAKSTPAHRPRVATFCSLYKTKHSSVDPKPLIWSLDGTAQPDRGWTVVAAGTVIAQTAFYAIARSESHACERPFVRLSVVARAAALTIPCG